MSDTKKAQKVYPKPSGPEVEFFLAPNEQVKRGEAIPMNINGHEYWVVGGRRNKLPKEALEVLLNAKSVATEIPDLKASDPYQGRQPRSQEHYANPPKTIHYHNNYDIEILSEK